MKHTTSYAAQKRQLHCRSTGLPVHGHTDAWTSVPAWLRATILRPNSAATAGSRKPPPVRFRPTQQRPGTPHMWPATAERASVGCQAPPQSGTCCSRQPPPWQGTACLTAGQTAGPLPLHQPAALLLATIRVCAPPLHRRGQPTQAPSAQCTVPCWSAQTRTPRRPRRGPELWHSPVPGRSLGTTRLLARPSHAAFQHGSMLHVPGQRQSATAEWRTPPGRGHDLRSRSPQTCPVVGVGDLTACARSRSLPTACVQQVQHSTDTRRPPSACMPTYKRTNVNANDGGGTARTHVPKVVCPEAPH